MDVHVGERQVAGELQPRHHHAGHPKAQNLAGCGQKVRRVEVVQIGRLVRPAESGKRPERGRKPGVQHVLVLRELVCPGAFHGFGERAGGDIAAARRVVDGNTVAPPELARQGPVPDAVHPVNVRFGVAARRKLNPAVRDNLRRAFDYLGSCHTHKPLLGQQRLNHGLGTVTVRDRMPVRLNLF